MISNKYKISPVMEKILISACLVGDKVRYDGKGQYHPLVKELLEKYELVPFCPEVEGGLKTPRVPSEVRGDRVINKEGRDVTRQFTSGAEQALNICKYLNIKIAILKDHSPSCGSTMIHNGLFDGRMVKGKGVTTQLLESHGIKVINENEIEELLK